MAISDQTVDRIWAILGICIVGIFVLGLIFYDFWSQLFRSKKE